MGSKRKISISIFVIMSIMFIILIINIVINFRNYGIKSVENKAQAIAQTVKHSLTSHMVNGVINNRSLFLNQITNLDNVDEIWLSRGASVIKQFGRGHNNEVARDEIDQKVLATGIEKNVVKEQLFGKSTYRVTIPYVGSSKGSINCLACHTTAKEGDTLGAISIKISIDDIKDIGMQTIFNTLIIALVLIIFILIFVNKLISPFLLLFEEINTVMSEAQNGIYSQRIRSTYSNESAKVAKWINSLLEKLETTLDEIDQKVNVFLAHLRKESGDPLIDVKTTVNRLAEIYKFKKTIEHDEHINDIYNRIAFILKDKFKIEDFNFIEADTTHKNIEIVYVEEEIHCQAEKGCRADRTNTIVDSCQFERICSKNKNSEDTFYLCIPYSISNDLDFVISIISKDEKEHKRINELLPLIQDYINTAKPEIVSKKLMHRLELTARTDPLTGLYNRKYLEESIRTIVSQAKRGNITYGILMVDIDFFKMINDSYGHDIGDEAIKVISQTLLENVRESDVVVRFGGEEFVVLLHNCDKKNILEIAEKIRISFSKKEIQAGTSSFSKTISIGASVFPSDTDSFWQCLKFADLALYEAKNTGRNKCIMFSKELVKDEQLKTSY